MFYLYSSLQFPFSHAAERKYKLEAAASTNITAPQPTFTKNKSHFNVNKQIAVIVSLMERSKVLHRVATRFFY